MGTSNCWYSDKARATVVPVLAGGLRSLRVHHLAHNRPCSMVEDPSGRQKSADGVESRAKKSEVRGRERRGAGGGRREEDA